MRKASQTGESFNLRSFIDNNNEKVANVFQQGQLAKGTTFVEQSFCIADLV
jgi:hypothetical protein